MQDELLQLVKQINELDKKVSLLELSDNNRGISCNRHYQELRDITANIQKLFDSLAIKANRGELTLMRNELIDLYQSSHDDLKGFVDIKIESLFTKLSGLSSAKEDAKEEAKANKEVKIEKIKSRTDIIKQILGIIISFVSGGGIIILLNEIFLKKP
jgi:hypothetical protein